MSRADILNLPHIAAKLEKLQSVHTDHEARMDRYHAEAMAEAKGDKDESSGKPGNTRRRRQKDRKASPRGQAPRPSRGDGVVDEAGGKADEGRGVQEGEEVAVPTVVARKIDSAV